MQAALSATPAVLTVELSPEAIAEGQRPPEPLSRDGADVLAGAVADDLRRALGDRISDAGLIVPGALYDITELLRPGLPMAEMMLDVYRSSLRGGPFQPHLLAIGASGGHFPIQEMAPARPPGAGPLLALPFAFVAPGNLLDPVRATLESELLEKGRASSVTEGLLRQQFGLDPVNLSFATFHDLSALMKVQLEYAGFGPLWRLLETALYTPEQPVEETLEPGNRFLVVNGRCWTPFLDFDGWVDRFGGRDRVTSYGDWQRVQRQYVAGLAAHGLEVNVTEPVPGVFAEDVETALAVAQQHVIGEQPRYTITVSGQDEIQRAAVITLTEQSLPELGPVAYTILAQDTDGALAYLGHDYPLMPEGIALIRDEWQRRAHTLGAAFHLERPGRLVVSGETPRLMPYLDYEGPAH